MLTEQKKRVVVIGGGITGLTAAFYLHKFNAEMDDPVDIVLIEAGHTLGGKIQTEFRDGFVIEKGPDSFLERKFSAKQLVKEAGLSSDLVKNVADQTYVYVKDQMYAMPSGAVMGVPTQLGSFLTTGLFSFQGKFRAMLDVILPKTKMKEDQPIGEFFRRRLGEEVVENLIEPLLSGVYAGDIDQLSLMSTYPQFYQLEQYHRSLILGMRKRNLSHSTTQITSQNQGQFITVKKGLQSIVDEIEKSMPRESIIKGAPVTSVKNSLHHGYEIELNHQEVMLADAVILAVPHEVIPNMLNKDYVDFLKEMKSTSVATVAMGFDEDQIVNLAEGTGFVVSRHSDSTITACTWTHKKWPHTAPPGKALLRSYIGRASEDMVVDLPDAEIERMVLEDLEEIMGFRIKPDFSIITRWIHAMPQYTVGHHQRVQGMKEELNEDMPGLFLAGSSFEGLGLPDCISQGEEAALQVREFLLRTNS